MKLVYCTPGIGVITNHISHILRNDYKIPKQFDHTNDGLAHGTFIIHITHEESLDLFKELLMRSPGLHTSPYSLNRILETRDGYYVTLSPLCIESLPVVTEIGQTVVESLSPYIYQTSYREEDNHYDISYHGKWAFHILDDMRHFGHRYLNVLNQTQMSREELNRLITLTIRLRCPRYIADEVQRYILSTRNKYASPGKKVSFSELPPGRKMHMKLSSLTNDANITTDKVLIDVDRMDVSKFIDQFIKNDVEHKFGERLYPDTILQDVFCTITIEHLIEFLDDRHQAQPHWVYFNSICKTLMENNNLMGFILTGRKLSI